MWEIDSTTLKYLVLTFMWIQFLWDFYLSLRQFFKVRRAEVLPEELKGVFNEKTFKEARLYALAKLRFGCIEDWFSTILSTTIIYCNLLAYAWHLAQQYVTGEVYVSCLWILILSSVSTITRIPFDIYNVFILEERFGFNKQTSRFFIWDKIKEFIVSQILISVFSAIVVIIVRNGGEHFFIWLWLGVFVISLLMLSIYPTYIAPLFDKYTELAEGSLRTRIEELASSLKFPLKKLYVVHGSKRSSHSNAYLYGFFNSKRIVLFDTLLVKDGNRGCTEEEVIAVLAHELGHWHHSHFVKNLFITEMNLLMLFWLFNALFQYPVIYEAFGFRDGIKPVLVGMMSVIQYVMIPYFAIFSFAQTYLSRYFEFQADKFAVRCGYSDVLIGALGQLTKDNLSFPINDWLFSMYNHSHPPFLERVDAIRKAKSTKQD